MAHHKSAKKRIKTNAKRQARNKQFLSQVRSAIKKFRVTVSDCTAGKVSKDQLLAAFRSVQSLLARACRKKIITKNAAARKTKRLYSLLKEAPSAE